MVFDFSPERILGAPTAKSNRKEFAFILQHWVDLHFLIQEIQFNSRKLF